MKIIIKWQLPLRGIPFDIRQGGVKAFTSGYIVFFIDSVVILLISVDIAVFFVFLQVQFFHGSMCTLKLYVYLMCNSSHDYPL
jgi:hypothetical protein